MHGYEDLARWVTLRNAVFLDDPDSVAALALIRARERGHVNLLALEDGEPVGIAMLADDPGSQTETHAYVEVGVVPERRGRGIGTALFSDISQRVQARGQLGLQCEALVSDSRTLDWLAQRGFEESYRLKQLVLAADDELADAPPPDGVVLHAIGAHPDLVGGMFEVAQASYGELAGPRAAQAPSRLEWQVYELGGEVDLDLSLVAERDGGVLGYSTLHSSPGSPDAFHRMTCVLPDLDAVARALLREQVVRAREERPRRMVAWALTTRSEGWLGSLGFRVCDESATLRGPLLTG